MQYSTLFVTLIMALGLSACAGPPGATGPPGYQSPTGRTGLTDAETVIVPTVRPRINDRWDNTYYYYDR